MARSSARRQQVFDAVARLSPPGGSGPGDAYALAALLVRRLDAGLAADRTDVALAVRALCDHFALVQGGRTVELRIPPYAAVQLAAPGEAGPAHTRGTPPNVVETDPETLLRLAAGSLGWDDAVAAHRVRRSGVHADIGSLFGRYDPS